MKLSIAFPILALSLALAGCDDHRSDWVDADTAQRVEEQSVPQLVEKAHPSEASKSQPATGDAAKTTTNTATADTRKPDKTVVEPDEGDEPPIDVDAKLFVKRLVIASGVDQREPVSPTSTFTKGATDRVYAFVEVGNEDKSPSAITVSFFRDGQPEKGGVELRVGASPRWRTWAYTRQATEPGLWHVVVRGPKGQELARDEFEIVAEGESPQASIDLEIGEEIAAAARG